jgi:parallel beta-helix repeat protein
MASTNQAVVVELASSFVGGALTSSSVWDRSMGIIHVTNNVVIPVAEVLSIEQGAVLLFNVGASIWATNASLIVNGTTSNTVCFLPADGTTVWGGLIVSGTNGDLFVRHAEIVAGHVQVLEGATGAVEDSYLHDYFLNSPSIIHALRAASFAERRCHVARYYEHLIQRTPVVIEDCLCENIIGDGIDFDGAPPGATIRRCTIRHGDLTNVDALDIGNFTDGTVSRDVIIEDCLIYDFPFDKGVSIGERAQDITVRNCVIYGVESGIAVKDSSVATIYNNTIVSSDYGLRLYEKIAGQGGGHATAYNNILWGNTNSISLANGSTITATYSDISGTGVYPGANNLNGDPLFLDPAQRDYRLATNSPCLGIGQGGTNLGALTPPGSLLVDTDGDGLPDPWEWGNGLDFNDAADATEDADGDGLTNWQEYWSGTAPLDPASALRLEVIGFSIDAVTLRFAAVGDKSYTLQYRTNAVAGAWQKLTDVPVASAGRLVEWPDPDAHQSGVRFYRLVTPAQPE